MLFTIVNNYTVPPAHVSSVEADDSTRDAVIEVTYLLGAPVAGVEWVRVGTGETPVETARHIMRHSLVWLHVTAPPLHNKGTGSVTWETLLCGYIMETFVLACGYIIYWTVSLWLNDCFTCYD